MMRKPDPNEDSIIRLLENLKEVPRREESREVEGRAAFLRSAAHMRPTRDAEQPRTSAARWGIFFDALQQPAGWLRRAAAAAAVVALALLWSTSLAVSAANAAQPGDSLYGLKLWMEDIQLALTFSKMGDLRVNLARVERRVAEVQALQGQNDPAAYSLAKSGLENSLQASQALFDELSADRNLMSNQEVQADLAAMGEELTSYWTFFNALDGADEDAGAENGGDPAADEQEGSDDGKEKGEDHDEEDPTAAEPEHGEKDDDEKDDEHDGSDEKDEAQDATPEPDSSDEHDLPSESPESTDDGESEHSESD